MRPKLLTLVVCVGTLGSASFAHAQETSEFSISSNITLASDYVSRGLSLNWGRPAVQAGIDVQHQSGWYVGAWTGQVSSNFYAGSVAELDLYAGYRGNLNDKARYEIGLAAYYYPGANYQKAAPLGAYPNQTYDTAEAVLGVTYDWLNLKYSYSLTNYFGYDSRTAPIAPWNSGIRGGVLNGHDTRGSGYLEANVTLDLSNGYTAGLHVGRQNVANSVNLSYDDLKVSIGKAWGEDWSASLAYSTTRRADIYKNFLSVAGNVSTADVSGAHSMLLISKAF